MTMWWRKSVGGDALMALWVCDVCLMHAECFSCSVCCCSCCCCWHDCMQSWIVTTDHAVCVRGFWLHVIYVACSLRCCLVVVVWLFMFNVCADLILYWHQRAMLNGAFSSVDQSARRKYEVIGWRGCLSVLWHCWLGIRKSIRPIKNEWWGTGVVICLECDANDLHMVHPIISCFSKIQNGLPFWCWLTQVVLEKRPLNICMCVWVTWSV